MFLAKLSFVIDKDTMNKILAILLPVYDQNDELIWGPAANVQFSIKYATWLHYKNSPPHYTSEG